MNKRTVSSLHPAWVQFQGDLTAQVLNRLSPAALAYIGDAVYELYVRCYFLLPAKRMADYHHRVVGQVRAEQQAKILDYWNAHLSSGEQAWVKKGRNGANSQSRRADPALYQAASGFETLVGYLFLQDPQRLASLLNKLDYSIFDKNQ